MKRKLRLFPIKIKGMTIWVSRRKKFPSWEHDLERRYQNYEWAYKFTIKNKLNHNKFSETIIAKNKKDAMVQLSEILNKTRE